MHFISIAEQSLDPHNVLAIRKKGKLFSGGVILIAAKQHSVI
jgi:hypothetical protein